MHRTRLDCYPSFTLKLHIIEHLGGYFTRRYRFGIFQNTVGKRAFTVVYMSDYGKIANLFYIIHRICYINPFCVVQKLYFGLKKGCKISPSCFIWLPFSCS